MPTGRSALLLPGADERPGPAADACRRRRAPLAPSPATPPAEGAASPPVRRGIAAARELSRDPGRRAAPGARRALSRLCHPPRADHRPCRRAQAAVALAADHRLWPDPLSGRDRRPGAAAEHRVLLAGGAARSLRDAATGLAGAR